MPTKKSIKLRDQKPLKDPVGGRKGGKNKHLNSAGSQDASEQRRRGRGRNRF